MFTRTTGCPPSRVWALAPRAPWSADHRARGWVRVYADLNGDGDALDAYEAQPAIHTDTLKTEIADPDGEDTDTDGIAAGEAIPAHFRIGIYHDPDITCQPMRRVRIGNVQVIAP